MPCRIFLAGAAGAIGRRLSPLLRAAGHEVFGSTRSAAKAEMLEVAGVTPLVVDVFDAAALSRGLRFIRPEVVIHQLTDLSLGFDPSRIAETLARNARLRRDGTRHLAIAAVEAGARRLIAQSIAWAYAPGPEPHAEADPLDLQAEGSRGVTVGGVAELERWTLQSPPLEGIVLRYGRLYGPGTGVDQPPLAAPLHVDGAASAALLAVGAPGLGVFNIAESDDYVSSAKARREFGWNADFRVGSSSTLS